MDLGFDRWKRGGQPTLDYIRLVSSVAATQAGSRTAIAEAQRDAADGTPEAPVDALVRLFDPAAGWAASVAALGGSFHPALAGSTTIRAREAT